ncbi:MAG: hypothetical protein U0Q07_02720 [Acidimicrobiales bacterium]
MAIGGLLLVLAAAGAAVAPAVAAEGPPSTAARPAGLPGTPVGIPAPAADDPLAVAAVAGEGRRITVQPARPDLLTTAGTEIVLTWGDPAAAMTRAITTITGATPPTEATVERGVATTFAAAGRTPAVIDEGDLTVTLPESGATIETALWVQVARDGRTWTSPLYDFSALTSRPQPTAEPGTRALPLSGANPAQAAFVPATTSVSLGVERLSISFSGSLPTRAAGQEVRRVTDVVSLRPDGGTGAPPFELHLQYADGRIQAYRAGDDQPLPYPAGPGTTGRDGSPPKTGPWQAPLPTSPKAGAFVDLLKAPLEAVLGVQLTPTTVFGVDRIVELADGTVLRTSGVSQSASSVVAATDPSVVTNQQEEARTRADASSRTRRWWLLGLGVLFAAVLVWGLVLLWPHVWRSDLVQRRLAKRRARRST